ncbi:uncharacterized protein [Montipora capricornis]|uniref:uncharacterized protein isoform X2 n=1 Tax=Montipora capricornis TaxID=246305 RepID=UPI0035F1D476
MAEWRKFAEKQKAKRRGKNQVVEESKVAEEIMVQRMSVDVSGKQQKSSRIGAQEYVPFEQDERSIRNIKDACQKHFGPQIEKDLVCDVLAGERGPSCNKMAQIPNKKVFYVRFVKPEGELEEEENCSRELIIGAHRRGLCKFIRSDGRLPTELLVKAQSEHGSKDGLNIRLCQVKSYVFL